MILIPRYSALATPEPHSVQMVASTDSREMDFGMDWRWTGQRVHQLYDDYTTYIGCHYHPIFLP